MAKRKAATQLSKAEGLLETEDFKGAASAAEEALGDPSMLSRAAVLRGKALLGPLLQQIMDPEQHDPSQDRLREPWNMFMLAARLDPENEQAISEMAKMKGVFEVLPDEAPPPNHDAPLDVLVVGAGASGVGLALMLTHTFGLDPERVLLIERGEDVGETFRRWPKEMRFISPSFNNQGWTGSFDLNSVAYGTSPAFTLQAEHPTGEQYAFYLKALVEGSKVRVQANTEVTEVRPRRRGGFDVVTVPTGAEAGSAPTTLRSRYVVWAAGEFQYPRKQEPLFPGSELCMHNSSVRSWEELPGDDFVVIGGYESGMDAAFNLASCDKRCSVVSSTAFWKVATDDPSTELAPYTAERVRVACTMPVPPRLLAPLRVFKVESLGASGRGGFLVHARWGAPVEQSSMGKHRAPPVQGAAASHSGEDTGEASEEEELAEDGEEEDEEEEETGEEGTEITLRTPQAPLLCAGFEGSCALGVAKELFEWGDGGSGCAAGSPLLNEFDESTKTPGLFLAGPSVRHGELSFCFVYKFRQRFGIVADAIARGLGRDTTEAVESCRKSNMFLDDFECCKGACGETC